MKWTPGSRAGRWLAGLAALALGVGLVSGGAPGGPEGPEARDLAPAARTAAAPEVPLPRPRPAGAAAGASAGPAGDAAASAPASAPASPLRRSADAAVVSDAFASRAWASRSAREAASAPAAASAASVAPAASAPPAPPPFPFTYIGRLTEQGEAPVYIFERGPRVFNVRPGQALDAQYRFEAATASELTIHYLPLGTRHTVRIGP